MMKPVFALALAMMTPPLSDVAAQTVNSRRVAALTGCWAVTVGTFQGTKVDPGMTTLPTMVQLDTLPGKDFLGKRSGWLIRAHPSTNGSAHREGRFTPSGADSIRMSWSSAGFVGLQIDAVVTGHRMDGIAMAWTDYGGEQRAPITLRRVTCP